MSGSTYSFSFEIFSLLLPNGSLRALKKESNANFLLMNLLFIPSSAPRAYVEIEFTEKRGPYKT